MRAETLTQSTETRASLPRAGAFEDVRGRGSRLIALSVKSEKEGEEIGAPALAGSVADKAGAPNYFEKNRGHGAELRAA